MISVIHPARNEHSEIAATVQSMLAAGAGEVLVYDDGSDTAMEAQPGTRHFRNDRSLGPSVCRNMGAAAATGDVLVFADAHTRIADLRGICAEAVRRQCIMVPAMQSLNGTGAVTGYGRDFILKGKGKEFIGFGKTNNRPADRYTFCGGNWGGFFIMPRPVYDAIGGWVNHSYWGFNDPSLILKAWMCGVPTVLDRDTIYKHKGKVKTGFGYPVSAKQPWINVLQTYFVLFEEEIFRTHWVRLFEQWHKWMVPEAMARILTQEVQEERAKFITLKKRPGWEFFSAWLPNLGYNNKNADADV